MSPIHIIISGASSVGKSTLVEECIKKFRQDKKLKDKKFKLIQEVARTVLNRLNLTGRNLETYINQNNINAFSNVQEKIIHEQVSAFEKEKEKNYLSDRSGFDALAYIHHYFKNQQKTNSIFESEQFQFLVNQCRDGLVFIIQPQEELQAKNDNMRMVPNYKDQIAYTNCLKYWYDQAYLPYFVITDLDMTKRVEFIQEHINGRFHWLPPEISIPLCIPFHLSKPKQYRHNNVLSLSSHSNQSYMRHIELLDKHNIRISYKKYDTNRLVEKYDPSCLNNKFASILFNQKLDNQFLEKILLDGIWINNQQYNFIGYSNSQLRGRSCYLYADSNDEIEKIIRDNGDFDKIKNISKRAARIGLLFSSCTPTIHIQSDHVIQIDDVERNNYTFTDGCGIIGRKLVKQIIPYLTDFKKAILSFDDENLTEEIIYPCAFQIRYQGYKGVLMINNDDNDENIQVRPSMKKFTSTISTCLYVCDDGYSGPRLGFLIKQYIILLSGLNIPDEIFLKKQQEHFDEILQMCDDMNIAMKYSLYFDRIDLIHHLLANNIQLIQSELESLQKKALESVEKLKIPITKSRLAFGVCDPYGILKPGEVYFRPTFNGRQFMIDSKICFVAKSPSYHLGDIRVLKLTSYKQLEHLYDVVVFPTRGQRPHPNEIAGSDLDGDKYLICWDNDLIPKEINKPMDYTSTAKSQELAFITRKEMISHFANAQNSNQSGIIDKYYNYWANLLGVKSIQCRRLAELFSAAVDAPKTGQKIHIPAELKPPRKEEEEEQIITIQNTEVNNQSPGENNNAKQNEFIWMKMLNNAKKFRNEFEMKLINENQYKCLSKETLLNLFFERRCPTKYNYNNVQSLNEYDLIISTIKWVNEQDNSNEILKDFIYLFDLSQLTMKQKQDIDLTLQINRSYLYSILNKSKILSNELIEKYHLSQTSLSWRLFYTSPKLFNINSLLEYQQTFQPIIYVLQQNSIHERILINISIDDTITLVLDINKDALINIPQQQTNYNQSQICYQIQPGLFQAYLESKLYSIRRKFLFDIDYFVKISRDRIQIYQNDPGNSFIVLMYDINNENKIISVDLTRFDRHILQKHQHPKVNRHEFSYFEIFVLSNDQNIYSSYYPIISYYDEEYYTQNYFHEQIENYQYIEYQTDKDKMEEEKYKKQQKEFEDKQKELISKFENLSFENREELIDEFMSIHDTEYLSKIWNYLNQTGKNLNELNEKFLEYFVKEINLMLNGSIYRPFINEQWFYDLLFSRIISQKNIKIFYKIYNLIKQMNCKLKDKSQPSYIPFLGRILQRLIKENFLEIQKLFLINDEFIYNLDLSLILGNNYNTDEINLNYFIEIHSLLNNQLTLKQLSHLIQSCLMTKNSEISFQFIQYLSNIQTIDEEQHSKSTIDYIKQFLSIIIRATIYDLDEINRRIKLKRDILIKNGETIFDLRAKLVIRKSTNQDNENNTQQLITDSERHIDEVEEKTEEKCIEPVFYFEHYQYERIPSHHFNIGDSIALIDQEELDNYFNKQNKTDEKPPLRLFYQSFGIILSIHPFLSIKFLYWPLSLTNNNYLNRQKLFRLERLPNFVTLNRSIDAFEKIIEKNDILIIKPLLNLTENIDKNSLKEYAQEKIKILENNFFDDNEYQHANLNDSQRQAIKNALENRLTLIQGPPGTGKTETSAWIIHLWLKSFFQEGQSPILICAETHQAVDNLTRRLLKHHYRLVRYGEPRTVAPDLHEYTMPRQIESLRREKQKSNPNSSSKSLFGPPKPKEILEILSQCQILCMTCSGVGILESSMKFPFILIDEASQITEPNILIPLVRITDQIVLVGDQKQLPPIIKMAEAKQLLERSFFERLLENLNINSIMLDTQYRMHPSLIDFPSKIFYNGLLKSGVTSEQRPTPTEITFINKDIPLMFVDVDQGEERIHGSNIYNKQEIEFICQTIQILLPRQQPKLTPMDIGVITPYTRQVKEIAEKLINNQIPKGVEVRTVDGFQGREKNIILISLVRSNNENEIGFLVNEQRMNVLLTRAKCAMIVFGNKKTLISNNLWKNWIENVPNINSTQFINYCLKKEQNQITTQHQAYSAKNNYRKRR
ncbi:unnamed protein product [Adineta steineri]|uniref:Helicase ATP-binding domain-containing protein n=1 Tax=Adineta steineri TaxID=433720 RepID=A0A815FTU1_9BILA|nr:unnamed protein product [Adineta steineri]CAF1328841.1 unnamed protein product [Adineta steineri]